MIDFILQNTFIFGMLGIIYKNLKMLESGLDKKEIYRLASSLISFFVLYVGYQFFDIEIKAMGNVNAGKTVEVFFMFYLGSASDKIMFLIFKNFDKKVKEKIK